MILAVTRWAGRLAMSAVAIPVRVAREVLMPAHKVRYVVRMPMRS